MPPTSVQGVLATSSLYENTDIILKLFSDSWELPVPILHVNFDAALDQGIEERIRSFLYYLQPAVPIASTQAANEPLVSEVSCGEHDLKIAINVSKSHSVVSQVKGLRDDTHRS